MSRRSPEQVHDEDGHPNPVASCARCATETEADTNAEAARAEPAASGDAPDGAEVVVGEHGPEVVVSDEDGQVVDAGDVRIAGRAGTYDEPLPDAEIVDPDPDAVDLPAERLEYVNGRVKCYADECLLPEFADGVGLCGAHWSLRPDLRKKARHG